MMNTRDFDSSDDNIQLYRQITEKRTHGGYERVTPGLNGGRRGGGRTRSARTRRRGEGKERVTGRQLI